MIKIPKCCRETERLNWKKVIGTENYSLTSTNVLLHIPSYMFTLSEHNKLATQLKLMQ